MNKYIDINDVKKGDVIWFRTREDLMTDKDTLQKIGRIGYRGMNYTFDLLSCQEEWLGKSGEVLNIDYGLGVIEIKGVEDQYGNYWYLNKCYFQPKNNIDIPEIETDDVDLCFLFS